jgi:hypothetical protein
LRNGDAPPTGLEPWIEVRENPVPGFFHQGGERRKMKYLSQRIGMVKELELATTEGKKPFCNLRILAVKRHLTEMTKINSHKIGIIRMSFCV